MITVTVLGAGHWGPHLIRNFDNRKRSRVAWVADTDPGRLEAVHDRHPDTNVTDDPMAAIADEAVDAVVVSTPTTTHHRFALEALRRGKHVLVEKPIATDSAEAVELTELADRSGLVLMVGHVFVYNVGVRRVKEYIDAGTMGRIYYVSMVRTNLGPIRTDVNALWDLAAHDISVADYWLGAHAVSASASGGSWINEGLEDAVFGTLRYPNDVLVNVHVSWLNPRKNREITVVAEKKMLTFDDVNISEPIRIYDKSVAERRTVPVMADTFTSFRASIREGDVTIPKVSLVEPLLAECDHFIDCIVEGRRPLTDGRMGTAIVSTLEAMERSLRSGGREMPVEHKDWS